MPRVFVYGALMAADFDGQVGRAAALPEHAVRFVARGVPYLEPAFAALVPEPGSIAHGALFEVTEEQWASITSHEEGYQAAQVHVFLDDCDEAPEGLQASALLLLGDVPPELAPSSRYAELLRRGAARCGLPTRTIERYADLARTGSKLSRYLVLLRVPVVALVPLVGFRAAVALVAVLCAAAIGGLAASTARWLLD